MTATPTIIVRTWRKPLNAAGTHGDHDLITANGGGCFSDVDRAVRNGIAQLRRAGLIAGRAPKGEWAADWANDRGVNVVFRQVRRRQDLTPRASR